MYAVSLSTMQYLPVSPQPVTTPLAGLFCGKLLSLVERGTQIGRT